MGEIIKSRVAGDKIVCSIAVNEEEAIALKGRIKNIHMFAIDLCDTDSTIIEKGKNGVVKYFRLPCNLRLKSKKKPELRSCQLIETDTSVFVINICEKPIL